MTICEFSVGVHTSLITRHRAVETMEVHARLSGDDVLYWRSDILVAVRARRLSVHTSTHAAHGRGRVVIAFGNQRDDSLGREQKGRN
jgi:hypothetical protein